MGKGKVRKVFLDELPRWEKGEGAGVPGTINWSKCLNMIVDFIYEDIKGTVEIVDYNKGCQQLTIKYSDRPLFKIKTNDFKNCQFGKLLGRITGDFKYEIGKIFKDGKRDFVITNREYKKMKDINYKYYKYTCNKCGWDEGWIRENDLNRGNGCACCANKIAVLGINTIWDTDRWMVDLGVSEEDAKKYTKGSDKKIEVTCPHCRIKQIKRIAHIYNYKTISCPCGDGISYPEKFLIKMLNNLGMSFEYQSSKINFDWCENYRYDFYIPECNMIIETHGMQHYEERKKKSVFRHTLNEQQQIDNYKKRTSFKQRN